MPGHSLIGIVPWTGYQARLEIAGSMQVQTCGGLAENYTLEGGIEPISSWNYSSMTLDAKLSDKIGE